MKKGKDYSQMFVGSSHCSIWGTYFATGFTASLQLYVFFKIFFKHCYATVSNLMKIFTSKKHLKAPFTMVLYLFHPQKTKCVILAISWSWALSHPFSDSQKSFKTTLFVFFFSPLLWIAHTNMVHSCQLFSPICEEYIYAKLIQMLACNICNGLMVSPALVLHHIQYLYHQPSEPNPVGSSGSN